MRVVVIGAGYVGLVTGVCLALDGHRVTFVERAPERVDALRRGEVPISEPGLAEAFADASSQIRVATQLESAVQDAELVMVAVGTPIAESGDSDLSQLRSAMEGLRRWPELDVVVRSTLPPGASARLPALLGRADGRRISTNPEFLRQGSALADYRHPTRVVIGVFPETSQAHLDKVEQLVSNVDGPRLRVSVGAAELMKNVANGFLALKLSFVNEVASLSEEYGVDVQEVLDGIAFDPRIGSSYMKPGLGFGGSCLPKELQVLAAAGRRHGIAMHVARAVSQVNLEQQDRFVRRILRDLPAGPCRVALLGLSFKANTDDLRGSPSIHLARRLMDVGHTVVAHDPVVPSDRAEAAAPSLQVASTVEAACRGADALVIGTDWGEYAHLDLVALKAIMRGDLLFDGRNLLDGPRAGHAGFRYRGVGRLPVNAEAPVSTPAAAS